MLPIRYRADRGAVLHAGIGKVSFSDAALAENASALVSQCLPDRPSRTLAAECKALIAIIICHPRPEGAVEAGNCVQGLLECLCSYFALGHAQVRAVLAARPKGVKGSGASGYMLRVTVASTMGPGFPVSTQSLVVGAQTAGRAAAGRGAQHI